MRKGYGVLFAAALAATLFVNPLTGPPAAPRPSNAPQSQAQPRANEPARAKKQAAEFATKGFCQADSSNCPAKGLLDAIQGSFGPAQDLKHWNVPAGERKDIRFVIATVPDPAHTRLGFLFDRQIDAIQEAVLEDEYLFAHSWMPWDSQEYPEDADYHVRLAQADYQSGVENYPGLMIFHSVKGTGAPLFVFVVGETPTGGINKDQFRTAIDAIGAICSSPDDCTAYPPAKSLYILGPMFSGSLYSLDALLQELATTPFHTATVHSGSASGYATIKWFESAGHAGVAVEFRTFQDSSDYVLFNFLRLSCSQGYRADEVALLSEDETAYGSEITSRTGIAREGAAPAPPSCEDESKLLQVRYPRNISQLRSAYERDMKDQPDADAKGAPRFTLQTSLDDNGSDDDTVAPYSKIQTPLSEEAVMLGISNSLAKHHIHFVVIEATSSLDTLFLIRFLRSTYSQARIVTVDTDLLLPRQVDDASLRGILEITPYPLIPGIDEHVEEPQGLSTDHRDRIFPGNYSAGTFNALLSLMKIQDADDRPNQEKAPAPPPCPQNLQAPPSAQCADLPPAKYAEYGWPAAAGPPPPKSDDGLPLNPLAPPLWLTVLGRDGYWPVAILDALGPNVGGIKPPIDEQLVHAIDDGGKSPQPANFHLEPPLGWIVLCCLLIALVVGCVVLLWRGSILSASRFVVNFAPIEDGWRNFVLFAAAAFLAFTACGLLWPWFHWSSGQFGESGLAWVVGGVALFGILIVSAEILVRGSPRLAATLAIGTPLLMAAVCLAAYLSRLQSHPVLNLWLYRYVHVRSGVSPLMPLIPLVGAVLWSAWYGLEGRALWSEGGYHPKLPAVGDLHIDETGSAAPRERLYQLTEEANSTLLKGIQTFGADYRMHLPPVLALLLSLPLVFPHPIRGFDGHLYDLIYWLSLTLILYLLTFSLCRLVVIWLELRQLLVALDRLPLRRGFVRISGFTWRPLWKLGGSAFEDFFLIVTRELEKIGKLEASSPSDPDLVAAMAAFQISRQGFAKKIHEIRGGQGIELIFGTSRLSHRLQFAYSDFRRRVAPKVFSGAMAGLAYQLRGYQKELACVAARVLLFLNDRWTLEKEEFELEGKDFSDADVRAAAAKMEDPTRFAEDFLCLFYFNFISAAFMSMRALIMMIAGIFVLVLLSFASYPFEPRVSFHATMFLFFAAIVSAVGFVFAQMHRDATLSRITKTTPGELGLDFWLRLAAFVSVPLFSLMASAFPSVGGFLFSWLQPATQAFK